MKRSWLLLLVLSGCTHLVWYGRSDDRRHIVAVLEEGGAQRVRYDLKDGPAFRGIGVDALLVTDDGHLIYPASPSPRGGEGRGEGWTVVVDGEQGPLFDAIGELRRAGPHLAYTAERAGRWSVTHLLLSSRSAASTSDAFDEILAGSLTLSATGRVAFVARRGDALVAVIDGTPSAPADGLGQLTFSPDGAHVGYVARRAGFQHVVIDGEVSPPFERVEELHLGPPHVFLAKQDGAWRAFVDGIAGPPFERIAGLLTAPGQPPAYGGRRGAEHFVVDGARTLGPYAQMRSQLARDARGRLVFVAQRDGPQVVVLGETEAVWDEVQVPVIAGEHVGFIAQRGADAVVVIDGEERSRWASADSLVLSADGRRHAHLATVEGRTMLVVDGKPQPVDLVVSGTLAFSKDGRRFGYVSGDRKKKRLFIQRDDGKRVPIDFEELVAALSRVPPESLITAPDVALLRRWVEAELSR